MSALALSPEQVTLVRILIVGVVFVGFALIALVSVLGGRRREEGDRIAAEGLARGERGDAVELPILPASAFVPFDDIEQERADDQAAARYANAAARGWQRRAIEAERRLDQVLALLPQPGTPKITIAANTAEFDAALAALSARLQDWGKAGRFH